MLEKLIDITPLQIAILQISAKAAGYRSIDFLLAGRAFETHTDEENHILTLEGSAQIVENDFLETDDGIMISTSLDPKIFEKWSESMHLAAYKPAIPASVYDYHNTDVKKGDDK